MAKLDKTRYSKQEATRLMEIRRLEKMSNDKKTEYAKRSKPIDFFQNEIVDESRFSHNQNAAFVLGNGLSRSSIEPDELRKYGPIYGCNALYRTFRSDYLVAVDVKMVLEINNKKYQHKSPTKVYSTLITSNLAKVGQVVQQHYGYRRNIDTKEFIY